MKRTLFLVGLGGVAVGVVAGLVVKRAARIVADKLADKIHIDFGRLHDDFDECDLLDEECDGIRDELCCCKSKTFEHASDAPAEA